MRGKIRKCIETTVTSVKYHFIQQCLELSWIIGDSMYLFAFVVCRQAVLGHGQTRQLLLVPTI